MNIDDLIGEQLSEIDKYGSAGNSWIAFGRYIRLLERRATESGTPYEKLVELRKEEIAVAVGKAFEGINPPNYDELRCQESLPESEQDSHLLTRLRSSRELYERCGPRSRDLLLLEFEKGNFKAAEKILKTGFPYS